jgi:hypothetical protein
MRTTGLALAAMLATATALAADYDSFGGWTGLQFEARNRFYVTEQKGTWWLVSPKGYAFFSKGVCTIGYRGDMAPALGYAPYGRATEAKYGSREKWADAVVARLREWGFNTAGSWSDSAMETRMPYTSNLNIAARAGANWQKGTMPDFFSQTFRETARDLCRKQCQPRRNDPNLLGYFTDNELAWAADWRSKKSLLLRYLELPAGSAGRRAAEGVLAKSGHAVEQVDRRDEEEFLALAAKEYFRTCQEAIRAADPNHLVLGCRFAGYAPDPVLKAMVGHADILSFNNYSDRTPTQTLDRLHQLTGLPVMITEFSFKAKDSGLPNTKGAAKPVETQKDRADGFERYVKGLAALPYCVGFHWFEWCDEPKEGRFDGENSNYGLVRIDDQPWEELTERMRAVNPTLDALHAGKSR